ncbi:heme-binding protein [Pseudomaricurvus alkylphenolicus]|jgi:uncharacterized protein GlcG (DUF336 family)|uniref:GlcG/HbpS family heme-binding protein n=1 Tax=Pseudomaricurvus alkylphenolicus TaxID=1306991 RepID=UPI00141F6505|nr:heme-binding protein [Pseudomaricurvus alkylphenolicus]NIB38082.1 heme-binding protein [Pseudomaricurvus alkylphenolicus]
MNLTLTASQAFTILGRAIEASESQSVPVAAVIVDSEGNTKGSIKADGVHNVNLDAARKKALTVSAFKMANHELIDQISRDDLAKTVLFSQTDLNLLPGGVPIMAGDAVIGALGVAGGLYPQDQAIAQYAVDSDNNQD